MEVTTLLAHTATLCGLPVATPRARTHRGPAKAPAHLPNSALLQESAKTGKRKRSPDKMAKRLARGINRGYAGPSPYEDALRGELAAAKAAAAASAAAATRSEK